MASDPTITCPNCSTEIKLTESLAAPLVQSVREEYEKKIREGEARLSRREADIKDQLKAVEKARESVDEQVLAKLKAERKTIAAEEARKARQALESDLDAKTSAIADLQKVLEERDRKLGEAQKAQAELIRKERALDDEKRELELTVEKRVQASVEQVRKQAQLEAEQALKLKVTEKEEQISSMQRQIETLKRKAEQGSEQLRGEVLELELEELLGTRFPHDDIEPVAKGEFGGDVLQKVVSPTGQACGSILWESKRTRNWAPLWLAKLREDQRKAKAELSVLVTLAMPREVDTFGLVDGIWVTRPQYALALVVALRQSLMEVAMARRAQDGQETKMEQVYQYLTGPRFRHRVEAIVEKFTDMQADLDRERKAMMRLWSKRETQIQGVIESTVGLYGDLQGIAGQALQEIEGLEVPLLESGDEDDDED
ncbi:MAG: DUF2130 domain-containing protein [Xanthomonadales bacterium]|nr:DUF2130 domain-containing protein [Xanthomonadales bacterium]